MSSAKQETPYQTTPYDIPTMPPGVPYIVGNEAAERFSFYGMKAILAVFMTQHLLNRFGEPAGMTEEQARAAIAYFVAAVYVTPFLGAVLADWLIGKYQTIVSLSLLYCAGHGVLALMDTPLNRSLEPKYILFWGLASIALGSGGIKPCVSAHVGDQFGRRNQHLLERVFGWFYFSINLGAFLSTIATPLLLEYYGASVAFGVPGVLMVLATLVFWMGRNQFVHIPPAKDRFWEETFSPEGLRALLNLAPLILFIAMFWCLFDQTASAWVLQADKMDRTIFGVELLTSQIQAANPLLILLLIPVFSYVVYPAWNRVFAVTPLRKIGLGLFVTVLSFVISAWIEQRIQAGERPHVLWQVLAYVVITTAEVMVSITGLEFSYTQAPKAMKSFIMALFLLSVTLGNLFTGLVNDQLARWKEQGYEPLAGAKYYWFFAACMLATAVVYVLWSQFYRGSTYIQGEEPADEPAAA
jgi:POT family proton-dependent oligopeptide transporter